MVPILAAGFPLSVQSFSHPVIKIERMLQQLQHIAYSADSAMRTENLFFDYGSNRHPLERLVDGIIHSRTVNLAQTGAALLRETVHAVYRGVLVISADQKHFGWVAHFEAEQQCNDLIWHQQIS